MSRFPSTAVALALMLASACDRFGEQAETKPTETEPAKPTDATKFGDATKSDTAAPSDTATPSDTAAPSDTATPSGRETGPRPPPPQTFVDKLEAFTVGSTPSADAEKTAWTHYKAKEYAQAQRSFALASLHDRVQWKHPFNLACASALAADEAMVQVALVEAMRRDGPAASKKIRSDDDLARYRSAAWFEPILRGEDPGAPPPQPIQPTDPAAPDDPVAPPTPTPTPTPAPAGAGQPLPVGIAKPLPKPKIEQLRDQLAKVHGLRPVVRGSLETTNANAESVAWVVYDYSRYDACVLKQSKKACRTKLGAGEGDEEEDEGEGEGETNMMTCTDQWIARATFGTTLVVDAPQPLKVACTADKLRRLDLVDIDGDGRQEVVLDISGSSSLEGFRESEVMDVGRVVKILRLDGTSQFDFSMAWIAVDITPDGGVAKRVFVRDTNSDGHLDLVIESVDFTPIIGSSHDLDFWPTGDEEEQDMGPVKSEIWLYDLKADGWAK